MRPPADPATPSAPTAPPGARAAALAPAARRALFAQQVEPCLRPLWCIAAAITNRPADADSIVQEALMIALEKFDAFDPATSMMAWLSTIVRFVALNERRRLGRSAQRTAAAPEVDSLAAEDAAAHLPIDAHGRLRPDQGAFDDAVVAALDDLDETARACLLLRVVLDLPYRAVALALSIPEGTAMSHVHRARAALRIRLADHASGTEDTA